MPFVKKISGVLQIFKKAKKKTLSGVLQIKMNAEEEEEKKPLLIIWSISDMFLLTVWLWERDREREMFIFLVKEPIQYNVLTRVHRYKLANISRKGTQQAGAELSWSSYL